MIQQSRPERRIRPGNTVSIRSNKMLSMISARSGSGLVDGVALALGQKPMSQITQTQVKSLILKACR